MIIRSETKVCRKIRVKKENSLVMALSCLLAFLLGQEFFFFFFTGEREPSVNETELRSVKCLELKHV